MNNEKFWVVWQPESGSPMLRHKSLESAINEAERLAKNYENREFYVLEAVSVSKKIAVQTINLH